MTVLRWLARQLAAVYRLSLRHPFLTAVFVILALLTLVLWRQENDRRTREHDAAEVSLSRCQDRNAQQAGTRGKFAVQNEVFGLLGVAPEAVARLSVVVGLPDDEDTDCTSDGQVDIDDYPEHRTPAEILAALRTAAGLDITSNPDAPVALAPVPADVTTTTLFRRRPTTTTTRPAPPTTSPPTTRPPPTPSTTEPCTLLGVFVPLCPLPGL